MITSGKGIQMQNFGNIEITGGFSPYKWNITLTSANNFFT